MVSACGKTRYPSSAKAAAALQSIRRNGARHAKKPTRAYPCAHCHGWHLTSEAA